VNNSAKEDVGIHNRAKPSSQLAKEPSKTKSKIMDESKSKVSVPARTEQDDADENYSDD
jgi:hypothetical protein